MEENLGKDLGLNNVKLVSRCFIVACIFDLVLGSAILGYIYYNYHDWEEVQVEYQESNCQDGVKGQHRVKTTYCELTISYEYKGEMYEEIQPRVEQNSNRSSTRLVDPANPGKTADNADNNMLYLLGCMFFSCGIFTGAITIVMMTVLRRRRKTFNDAVMIGSKGNN